MEDAQEFPPQAVGRQLIVKADEVDQEGTAIQSPTKQLPLSALDPSDPKGAPPRVGRPLLRREGSAPPPPVQPPPPAPPGQNMEPPGSLSLPQLKQLVSQFPKVEQRAYAFQYADTDSFEVEIEDWFQYTADDTAMLLGAQRIFEQRWKLPVSWPEADLKSQKALIKEALRGLGDENECTDSLRLLLYVLGGAWASTTNLEWQSPPQSRDGHHDSREGDRNTIQIDWMHRGVDLIVDISGLQPLFTCLKTLLDEEEYLIFAPREEEDSTDDDVTYRNRNLAMTCWYIILESLSRRADSYIGTKARNDIDKFDPDFLVYLAEVIGRQRWEELHKVSVITKVFSIFWKALLLFFGDSSDALGRVKQTLQPPREQQAGRILPPLTASPLEYHLFRQEITSKYPAYNPPLPLVPFELEHKSMLPPLPHHPSRANAASGSVSGLGQPDGNVSGSIFHQPVHIATPAPSPPPSPIGPGGKTGKKQNYQTNQNFPFLYPPLDDKSNKIGGKGTTAIQDLTVGKTWEGSDIPISIIEAGQLFASRMRMTRAMKQMWKERELYLKEDRGWETNAVDETEEEEDWKTIRKEALQKGQTEAEVQDVEARMRTVDSFYRNALPSLQSIVIVMMKAMLFNVQEIAKQNGSLSDNQQSSALPRTRSNPNVTQANNGPVIPPPPQPSSLGIQELNETRLREVCHKAIAGSLSLLLKWFKISHVLKFEYLTQLLLDSNYIPLSLKYFAHQNLEEAVAIRYEREDLNFFHFCRMHSDHPPLSPTSPGASSESSIDEAMPPPIHRQRPAPNAQVASPPESSNNLFPPTNGPTLTASPEPLHALPAPVDEHGNPLRPYSGSPITEFSFRQFHIAINLLRILQKVTRSKSHRILLVVQYKSTPILRRLLKVPDPTLRLYVLKLFKSQVPYCGRKWRQQNMKVITAIYLHCRPELRDEWLAGMHELGTEGEEDALPLEWAVRGLTFWWMRRRFGGDVTGGGGENQQPQKKSKNKKQEKPSTRRTLSASSPPDHDLSDPDDSESSKKEAEEAPVPWAAVVDSERDFFQRELDAVGWGVGAGTDADSLYQEEDGEEERRDGGGGGAAGAGIGGEGGGGSGSGSGGERTEAAAIAGLQLVSVVNGDAGVGGSGEREG